VIRDHGHRANLERVPITCTARGATRAAAGRATVAGAGGLSGHLHLVPNVVLQLIRTSGQLISGVSGGRQSEIAIGTAQATFNGGIAGSGRRTLA
jgi:hypothetical protein